MVYIQEIIHDYEEGLGYTRLSKKYHLPRCRIIKILKNSNIQIREQKESQKGRLNNNWKGGKYFDSQNRVWITTKEYGQILESHFVFLKFHNLEYVPEGYVIHHKDHNPQNNNIDNLELMSLSQHSSYHDTERWNGRQ